MTTQLTFDNFSAPEEVLDVHFSSNELLVVDQSEVIFAELAKTTTPQYIEQMKKQAGHFSTDLRRLVLSIESRVNWFFKKLHPELSIAQPDNSKCICLDTMKIIDRKPSHQGSFANGWLFRWSSEDALSSIGIHKTRRDVKVEQLFDELYNYKFFLIGAEELDAEELAIKSLSRILLEISTPHTNINEDANYFSIAPGALDRIVKSRAGMMFKSTLLTTLPDSHLELLQFILRYIDKGGTPNYSRSMWIRLLYKGKKAVHEITWSHFKRDNINRLLPRLEKTFNLELEVVEKATEKEGRKVKGMQILIRDLCQDEGWTNQVFVHEKKIMVSSIEGGRDLIEHVEPEKITARKAKPVKRSSSGTKGRQQKVPFSIDLIRHQDKNSVVERAIDFDALEKDQRARFFADVTDDFQAHNEGRELTQSGWRRAWIRYSINGWKMNSEEYLTVSGKSACTQATCRKALIEAAYQGGYKISELTDDAKETLLDIAMAEEVPLFVEHYKGKAFTQDLWKAKLTGWFSKTESVQKNFQAFMSKVAS